ncbi:MAG TPA: PASTA domain-containing protein [Thermoanaerobaculia bacterium]|nr:PASTA domain-containing protein [Thermoanaerobaculia bacterium]
MRTLGKIGFAFLVLALFGGSSYFWFSFFVKGKSIPTPKLIGQSFPQAKATTSDLGLVLELDRSGKKDRHADAVPKGAVVWQNRAPGSLIKRGTRIHVGQSLGPLVLSVPDLTGQSARTAVLRFGQRNLAVGSLSYLESSGPTGVLSADPPVGTVVAGQTAVSLLIGSGKTRTVFVMPDIIDRALADIRPALGSNGLTVSNVKYEPYPGIRDGIVIRQFPLPGSPIGTGDVISLVVSKKPEGEISEEPLVALPQPVMGTVPQP